MNNFISKLYKFMNGRYGIDELFYFLIMLSFILLIIKLFVNSIIINIIETIIFIMAIYRFLSKKKIKRSIENNIYLNIKDKIINYFKFVKRKYDDRNTHIYKKCPKCKQKIRLPLKKGKHTVKCPNCKETFSVRCYRNEKIKVEIVK